MLGIAELIIIGLIIEYIFRCIKLPSFIGVLLFGLLISPYEFGLISNTILENIKHVNENKEFSVKLFQIILKF